MKLTEAKLKKMIKEQLEEAYDNNRYSKIKPWSAEAAGLVYYDRSDSTPPIPPGYVRTAAVIDGTRQPNPARLKRYQKNHVVIYLKQPGFKAVEEVPVSEPRGAEELQRQMDIVEKSYQDTLERLGPDEPNKDEDWNAWYTWTSQKLQSTERYNDSMGKLRTASTVRLPYEYGEGEQSFVEHEIQLDGKFIEPADDGRYIDVANFILKRKKITDQYGNLLDYNGRIIAGKKLQKRFSGASDMPWAEYVATLRGNLEEEVPRTGVYAVKQSDIEPAKRVEAMYRKAGLTEKADLFKRAIDQALAGEIDLDQFHKMLDSAKTLEENKKK